MKNICKIPGLALLVIVGVSGCDEPRNMSTAEKKVAKSKPEAKDVTKPREIIGKTTTDIRETKAELGQGGVVAKNQEVARKQAFSPSKQYISAIDRVAALNIQHAVELYRAETGNYPKDYNEFMQNVIKKGQPDEIRLPQLPYYQEYSYDAEKHELIVIEYPDRKAAVEKKGQ